MLPIIVALSALPLGLAMEWRDSRREGGNTNQGSVSPCKAPYQFSARFVTFDQDQSYGASGVFQYDLTNLRTAKIFQGNHHGTIGDVFQQISIWDKTDLNRLTQYNIDLTTQQCKTYHYVGKPFREFGVPPRYNNSDQVYVGGPGENIDVLLWQETYTDGEGSFSAITEAVTLHGCWPVSYSEVLPATEPINELDVSFTQWYDVVGGVIEPTMFTPPSYCGWAEEEEEKFVQEMEMISKEFIMQGTGSKMDAEAASFSIDRPPRSLFF